MDKQITLRVAGPGDFPPFIPARRPARLADVEVRDGSPTGAVLTTVQLKATGDHRRLPDASARRSTPAARTSVCTSCSKQLADGPASRSSAWGTLNWVSFNGAGIGTKEE